MSSPLFKHCTQIKMLSGNTYTLDKKINQEDMSHIMDIWSRTRTEAILRIEQDAEQRIFNYLREKGYRMVAIDKIQLV